MGMWLGLSFSAILGDLSKILLNPKKIVVKNYFVKTEPDHIEFNVSPRTSNSNIQIPRNHNVRRVSMNNYVF